MLRSHSTIPAVPPIDDEPVSLKARRRSAMGSIIGHTGFNVARYQTTHVFGALFPLLAGVLVFGWRALLCVLIVTAATVFAGFVWRRIGARGRPLRPALLLWLGVVMSMMLPASLVSAGGHPSSWPILLIAGLLLVIVCWLFGGIGSGRFHPAVVVYLLLALLYGPQLKSGFVLQHDRLLVGDLLAAPARVEPKSLQTPWKSRRILIGQDAIHCVPPAESLIDFTTRQQAPDGSRVSAQALLRDHLPPMEDCVLGAVPGGIGVTSAVAIIIGGLFLLYRGLIDYRIPLLITLAAWMVLIALPIPTGAGAHLVWRWFPGHVHGIGWEMAVSLANYQVLASPLLFTAFFLAGSPSVRPLTRRGRTVYALLLGALAAGIQMYISVSLGSYLALLLVGLLTPYWTGCLFLGRWYEASEPRASYNHFMMTAEEYLKKMSDPLWYGEQDENGVDLSIIRRNLSKTPTQRLRDADRATADLIWIRSNVRLVQSKT